MTRPVLYLYGLLFIHKLFENILLSDSFPIRVYIILYIFSITLTRAKLPTYNYIRFIHLFTVHAWKKSVYFFEWLLWVKKAINVKYFVDALNLLFSRWDYQKVDLCAYPGQAVYWEDDFMREIRRHLWLPVSLSSWRYMEIA